MAEMADLIEQNRAKAATGAEMLDQRGPHEWWREEKIDVGALDMGSAFQDILGQLYGTYWRGLKALGLLSNPKAEDDYGFASVDPADWEPLADGWCQEVLKRRRGEK